MYLLGSNVADTEVPAVTEQIKKFVADFGGKDIVEQQLGKKKLAYPIGKTRNGHYVVVNFAMDGKKVNDLDAKIRTQENTIIRYLLINLEEHLERTAKDKIAQAKLNRREPVAEGQAEAPKAEVPAAETPAPAAEAPQEVKEEKPKRSSKKTPVIELDQEELDKKIEAALSEDLSK
jgi:small subunit ribosomal protein S6